MFHEADPIPTLTESLAVAAAHCAWHKLLKRCPLLTVGDWDRFRDDMKKGIEAGLSTQARNPQD